MGGAANVTEALLLIALGFAAFRALRPLRDRLERWYASWLPGRSDARVVRMRRRRDGAYEAEETHGGE